MDILKLARTLLSKLVFIRNEAKKNKYDQYLWKEISTPQTGLLYQLEAACKQNDPIVNPVGVTIYQAIKPLNAFKNVPSTPADLVILNGAIEQLRQLAPLAVINKDNYSARDGANIVKQVQAFLDNPSQESWSELYANANLLEGHQHDTYLNNLYVVIDGIGQFAPEQDSEIQNLREQSDKLQSYLENRAA